MINTTMRLEDRSITLTKRTSQAGIKAYKKAGRKITKIVKDNAAYKTGLLKSAISHKVQIMDGIPIMDVGAKKKVKGTYAYHAHLVEKGTGNRINYKTGKPTGTMSAKPFLSNNKDMMQQILENTIKEEMKGVGDG